jgi:hypothetical protein
MTLLNNIYWMLVIIVAVYIDSEMKPDPRNDAILVWAPAIDLSDGKGKYCCYNAKHINFLRVER